MSNGLAYLSYVPLIDHVRSGNMGKPTLDLIIFTTQLATSLGAWGTIGLFANYGFTVWILKKATPAFGKLKTVEASMEGEYRSALGRIGREAEEVACVGIVCGGRTVV